jgi:hypothetical protein
MTSMLQACDTVNASLHLLQTAIHMSIVVLACMYYATAMAVVLHIAAANLSYSSIRHAVWEPLVSIKPQLRLDLCLTGAVQE